MQENSDRPVSVRLTAEERRAIDEEARRRGLNRSDFLRNVILAAMNEQDRNASAPVQTAKPQSWEAMERLSGDLREVVGQEVYKATKWLNERQSQDMQVLAQQLERSAGRSGNPGLLEIAGTTFISVLLVELLANHGPELLNSSMRYLQSV